MNKNIVNIITCIKANSEDIVYNYVDYTLEDVGIRTSPSNVGFNMTPGMHSGPIQTMSMKLFTIDVKIEDKIEEDLENIITKKIYSLAKNNFETYQEKEQFVIGDDKYEKYTINELYRQIFHKINMSSNYIAMGGRIGSGTHILVSPKNYKKYHLDMIEKQNDVYTFILNPNVHDIVVYRNNTIDQSGLKLIYCDDKYSLEEFGNNSEKHYMLLELDKKDIIRKNKLKTIIR